ncbi:MAG: hypothetical protein EPO40_16030 [Myxococcaceae bacterium]|nr:MAG: hypothetical protein EPO40_16030 [Myxococcaceae bacterium]
MRVDGDERLGQETRCGDAEGVGVVAAGALGAAAHPGDVIVDHHGLRRRNAPGEAHEALDGAGRPGGRGRLRMRRRSVRRDRRGRARGLRGGAVAPGQRQPG